MGETSGENTINENIHRLKYVVDIFSHKWNPQVLYVISQIEPIGYSEIGSNIDVSSKMLSNALDELVDYGLIRRYEHDDSERILYAVTPQGEALASHLESLIDWQKAHNNETEILLIEDDRMATELIRDQIDQIITDSYTLYHESTASQALSRISQETDYVILDRRLPDGKQAVNLTQRIRDMYQSCYILVLSGVVPGREILKLAIDSYLEKPADREELAAHIESFKARQGLTDVKQAYLAARSKQVALRSAHGWAAESRSAYQLLNEIISHLPISKEEKTTLESHVPPVSGER